MNDEQLREWAEKRADDAGRLARELLALKTAFLALVDRLDEIHQDPAYMAVWTVHQMHVGPYRGPTYVAELVAARAALKDAPP